jgi:prefoldin subunit 5
MVRHDDRNEVPVRSVSYWKPWVRDAALVVSVLTGFGVAIGAGRSMERIESSQRRIDERLSDLSTILKEHTNLPAHWESSALHREQNSKLAELERRIERVER